MDVVVIGGGIVGLAVARELTLRHEGIQVAVLEREPRIASGQTGSTSGVIHAGVYYEPGSLKAKLCVEGAEMMYAYCDSKGIEARRDGKLVLASRGEELPALDELERRARANGVPGLRRLRPDEISGVEPHAVGAGALHSPNTGVVDFTAVAEALAADVRGAGGTILVGHEVRSLTAGGQGLKIRHDGGTLTARFAIACAGARADRLAIAAGAPKDPRIVPFRGAYLELRTDRARLVRASVYPVPDPELPFLGAHLTRTFDGRVLLGPTALMTGGWTWPGAWRVAWRHRRAALREMHHAASRGAFIAEAERLVPDLEPGDFVRGPHGTRAQAVARGGTLVDDFVVHRTERALHVRNAPSPAATSSLALARLIADRAANLG